MNTGMSESTIMAIKAMIIWVAVTLLVLLTTSSVRKADYSDAYEYMPAGVRAAPKYTDVKMFECSWCHRKKNLSRHHVVPQSADSELINDYSNIIVLCHDCHFILGHRANYKYFNPDVVEIVNTYTNNIKSSEYNKALGN